MLHRLHARATHVMNSACVACVRACMHDMHGLHAGVLCCGSGFGSCMPARACIRYPLSPLQNAAMHSPFLVQLQHANPAANCDEDIELSFEMDGVPASATTSSCQTLTLVDGGGFHVATTISSRLIHASPGMHQFRTIHRASFGTKWMLTEPVDLSIIDRVPTTPELGLGLFPLCSSQQHVSNLQVHIVSPLPYSRITRTQELSLFAVEVPAGLYTVNAVQCWIGQCRILNSIEAQNGLHTMIAHGLAAENSTLVAWLVPSTGSGACTQSALIPVYRPPLPSELSPLPTLATAMRNFAKTSGDHLFLDSLKSGDIPWPSPGETICCGKSVRYAEVADVLHFLQLCGVGLAHQFVQYGAGRVELIDEGQDLVKDGFDALLFDAEEGFEQTYLDVWRRIKATRPIRKCPRWEARRSNSTCSQSQRVVPKQLYVNLTNTQQYIDDLGFQDADYLQIDIDSFDCALLVALVQQQGMISSDNDGANDIS